MKQKKKLSLASQIFIALILAIIAGLLLQKQADFANGYIKPFGTIFLNLLKFIICPIVLFSIMGGILSMKDIKKVGSIGLKTIVYFFATTALAITIGLFIASLSKGIFPILDTNGTEDSRVTTMITTQVTDASGNVSTEEATLITITYSDGSVEEITQYQDGTEESKLTASDGTVTITAPDGAVTVVSKETDGEEEDSSTFMDTLVNIFPSNFLQPFVDADMLQVIVIALILGFAIVLLGERAAPVAQGVELLNDVFVKAMNMILSLSPIGVFCLLCPVIAENGAEVIGSLGKVLLIAYVCYIVQTLVVYCTTVHAMGGISFAKFLKGMAPAMLFAFSSASSVGTLPINTECCEKMGADKDVTSFVLPLGATINMGGTAIYQGVCAVFIAACYGIELSLGDMAAIVITGTLAAVGTAGVPGAGPIMLTMVLSSAGLPVEGIALVMGVDRIFDMGRTVLNITGDAACAVIVSNMERKKEAKKAAKLAAKNAET